MKTKLRTFAVSAALVALAFTAHGADEVIGTWDMNYDFQGTDVPGTLTITAGDDGALTGTWTDGNGSRDLRNVKFENGMVTFDRDVNYQGTDYELVFSGEVDGDAITGAFDSPVGDLETTGKRQGGGTEASVSSSSDASGAAGLVGTWKTTTGSDLGTVEANIEVRLQLVGWFEGDMGRFDLENMKLDGDTLTFNMTIDIEGTQLPLEFEGKIDGTTLSGEFKSEMGNGQVTGEKVDLTAGVRAVLDDVMTALKAQDIDAMIAKYADDFSSDQGDKAAMAEFLSGAKEQGFLEDLEVDLSEIAITVEGSKASVEGIQLEGAFGALNLEFELENRDGTWLVTSQVQY